VRVAGQEAAVAALRERLRPGDVVLVKDSRHRTWEVADWLRESAVEPVQEGVVAR
jgi:UDP-N-acetylmuramoyl-tripeptide--D-alanyl-D-alanine ligase